MAADPQHTSVVNLVSYDQPQPLFFKDKGGKRNQLHFQVGLDPRSKLVLANPLPLKVILYTETEARQDEVLWCHQESYEIRPGEQSIDVWFRIEKVSSKAGLFKLWVGPNEPGSDERTHFANAKQAVVVNGIFSDLIEVRSKVNDVTNKVSRVSLPAGINSPAQDGGNGSVADMREHAAQMADEEEEVQNDELSLPAAVTQLAKAFNDLTSAVSGLEVRLGILHKRLAIVEAATLGTRNRSQSFATVGMGMMDGGYMGGGVHSMGGSSDPSGPAGSSMPTAHTPAQAVNPQVYIQQRSDSPFGSVSQTAQLQPLTGTLPPSIAAAASAAAAAMPGQGGSGGAIPTMRMPSPGLMAMSSPGWAAAGPIQSVPSSFPSMPGLSLESGAGASTGGAGAASGQAGEHDQGGNDAASASGVEMDGGAGAGGPSDLPSAVLGGTGGSSSPTGGVGGDPSFMFRGMSAPSTIYDALFTTPVGAPPPIPVVAGAGSHRDSFDFGDSSAVPQLYGSDVDADGMDAAGMFSDANGNAAGNHAARMRGGRKRSMANSGDFGAGDDINMGGTSSSAAAAAAGMGSSNGGMMAKRPRANSRARAMSEASIGGSVTGLGVSMSMPMGGMAGSSSGAYGSSGPGYGMQGSMGGGSGGGYGSSSSGMRMEMGNLVSVGAPAGGGGGGMGMPGGSAGWDTAGYHGHHMHQQPTLMTAALQPFSDASQVTVALGSGAGAGRGSGGGGAGGAGAEAADVIRPRPPRESTGGLRAGTRSGTRPFKVNIAEMQPEAQDPAPPPAITSPAPKANIKGMGRDSVADALTLLGSGSPEQSPSSRSSSVQPGAASSSSSAATGPGQGTSGGPSGLIAAGWTVRGVLMTVVGARKA